MELLIRLTSVAATLLLCCCTNKNDGKTAVTAQVRPRHVEKPHSASPDTLTVRVAGAVFFSPDSVQLEKVKDLLDTSVYKAIMHDYFYQVRNARKVVRESWPGLASIDAKDYRYLSFMKRDGTGKCIDLDKEKELYGILLFDGKKDPAPVDMPNIKTALGFYFTDQARTKTYK